MASGHPRPGWAGPTRQGGFAYRTLTPRRDCIFKSDVSENAAKGNP